MPVPVESPSSLQLFRVQRDFGLSAIIVGIVAAAAVGASVTASAIALTSSIQTADTLNNLSFGVATALDKQASLHSHIKGSLMLVNQCIDLVQEQVDTLWQLAQLGCEWKMAGLCITSIQYQNFTHAANLSKTLSQFLLQNWTLEFDDTLRELRFAIVQVNSTQVDPVLAEGLTAWIQQAVAHLKEWAGIGVLALMLVATSAFCLLCICRLVRARRRNMALMVQAFNALEAGVSPQAWLAGVKL